MVRECACDSDWFALNCVILFQNCSTRTNRDEVVKNIIQNRNVIKLQRKQQLARVKNRWKSIEQPGLRVHVYKWLRDFSEIHKKVILWMYLWLSQFKCLIWTLVVEWRFRVSHLPVYLWVDPTQLNLNSLVFYPLFYVNTSKYATKVARCASIHVYSYRRRRLIHIGVQVHKCYTLAQALAQANVFVQCNNIMNLYIKFHCGICVSNAVMNTIRRQFYSSLCVNFIQLVLIGPK